MKPIQDRIKEIQNIYMQLSHIGIQDDLSAFKKIANDYVRNGLSIQGSIFLPDMERYLEYNLTSLKTSSCTVCLRAQTSYSRTDNSTS